MQQQRLTIKTILCSSSSRCRLRMTIILVSVKCNWIYKNKKRKFNDDDMKKKL
ncbi:hypothetical protein BDE02_14G096800 [Populus trichocarpa]|nr:hypothetical protein BDE02_14G096800 [Populus trichocarpa]